MYILHPYVLGSNSHTPISHTYLWRCWNSVQCCWTRSYLTHSAKATSSNQYNRGRATTWQAGVGVACYAGTKALSLIHTTTVNHDTGSVDSGADGSGHISPDPAGSYTAAAVGSPGVCVAAWWRRRLSSSGIRAGLGRADPPNISLAGVGRGWSLPL